MRPENTRCKDRPNLTAYPHLFSPIEVGGFTLRNRVGHASIVTRFVQNGEATDPLIHYYENRARGGAGLIVGEPLAMISAMLCCG